MDTLGIICTPEQLKLSQTTGELHCLTRGQSIGLSFKAEAGFVSLACLLYAFGLFFYKIYKHAKLLRRDQWRVFQAPMDVYMVSLFTAGILQALGAILNVRYIQTGVVQTGEFCNAHGAVQEVGEVAVALTSIAIAVHTFIAVWWQIGTHARRWATLVVVLCWIFVIVLVSAAVATLPSYEEPSPYWCFIGSRYPAYRVAGEYLWWYATLGISLAVYVPLHYWRRGNITVDQNKWWKFHVHPRADYYDRNGSRRQSLSMIAYPLVYVLLVLPIAVTRFVQWGNTGVPSAATLTFSCIFSLTGAGNVLLFFYTRPNLLLLGSDPEVIAREDGHLPTAEPIEMALPTAKGSWKPSVEEVQLPATEGGWRPSLEGGRLPSERTGVSSV